MTVGRKNILHMDQNSKLFRVMFPYKAEKGKGKIYKMKMSRKMVRAKNERDLHYKM